MSTNNDRETRAYTADLELRASDKDNKRKLVGYAALYNSEGGLPERFIEKFSPGAFAETISNDDVRALHQHDPRFVLARTSSGTLRLENDERGVKFEIDPPDTQWANDLIISINRRDITQMSFGFMIENKETDQTIERRNGIIYRTIHKAKLLDISPVAFPFYQDTNVLLRSMESLIHEPKPEVKQADPNQKVRLNLNIKKIGGFKHETK